MSYKTKSKTVLVVEDVAEISFQMGAMLRRKGHRILNAADVEDAIEIAERVRPSLILTDLDLPSLETLLRRVNSHKDISDTVVAVIDINNPHLPEHLQLRVLSDFDQLDELLAVARD